MGVLSEALESITAAFLGSTKDLEARASLQAKVASRSGTPGVSRHPSVGSLGGTGGTAAAAAGKLPHSASLGPLQREASARAALGAGGASMRALASGSSAVAAAAAAAAAASSVVPTGSPAGQAGNSSGRLRPSPVRERPRICLPSELRLESRQPIALSSAAS
ncbi:hypothetical protein FOA52_015156 [Chlamydomonas sp. UWO 241]|nr:hypothetical protein FOA52_015156 [Chlamydomonas sp. UWO 241]